MLMKADIMLLDEPTNHLDVKNVAWLEDYLTHLPDVTSMVVSHDSGFLDHVCTGIIHYENRKLKHYKVHTYMDTRYTVAPAHAQVTPEPTLQGARAEGVKVKISFDFIALCSAPLHCWLRCLLCALCSLLQAMFDCHWHCVVTEMYVLHILA